ncbi:MAG: TRAP transporter substrate-binding protein DctP [Synergistaceae bacterium]|jgi:TRAP-type C4-dicarboxylate transport system substrate-binding protein|nr:TRAP transporter substrate-binding protein DctP [Synergistaceae bacterium]
MGKSGIKKVMYLMIGATLLLASGSCAEAKALKLYALYSQEGAVTKGLFEAVEEIEKRTNGSVQIKVYPDGQLCGWEEVTEEVRQGTIEIASVNMTKRDHKRLDLLCLPSIAPLGVKQLDRMAWDEDSILRQEIEGVINSMNLHSLGPWIEPPATLVFRKGGRPESFTDFESKRKKIRVVAMPMMKEAFTKMGYQTVTIAWAETMSALQTGQVDGSSGFTFESAALVGKDVIKHIDNNRVQQPLGWMIINEDVWNGFSPDEQKIVKEVFDEYSRKTLKASAEEDIEYERQLKGFGIEVVNYTDEEYVTLARFIRENVWVNYYEDLGEDVMKKIEARMNEVESAIIAENSQNK